ncbi:CoA ester lyase [Arthrobacter sp. M2012083]|uniref:HpcH/HpaI aldolase/citrate lyase family protein n=1 Tax=Arthrobacter sp. M2012083 TaxID=1197706 RepID=UPI00031D3733|nr:CoA ester lyase [Arthrobacter sp. M2012083]
MTGLQTLPRGSSIQKVASAATALFVPGDRPERFEKAALAGADIVIIDLEDAVAPPAKADALAATVAALRIQNRQWRALVRVNAVGSASYEEEIAQLYELANLSCRGLLGLMVPKAADSPELRELSQRCASLGLAFVPLIESAAGVLDAPALAKVPGVTRLAFGAIDYALDIHAGREDRFLDYARSVLVLASRAAGIAAPLDSPATTIKDIGQVEAAARLSYGFGFGGKLCIHPAQVPVVSAAFLPDAEAVRWAQTIVSSADGAIQVDGEMIDRPVIERARLIMARVEKDRT